MGEFIHYINTNYTMNAIPMFGYWEGNIGADNPSMGDSKLNVTLGRMVCRVNVTIANKTASEIKSLKFTNASNMCYYFPQISSPALPAEAYCTKDIARIFELGVETNEAATIYFYWGPNFCNDEAHATKMTFTDEAGKTYSCLLTNSPQSDESIDYNLYYNCNYTITATIQ